MQDRRVTTKAELIAEIQRAWTELNRAIDRLSDQEMTIKRDAQGWTAKDHLIHLASWERSVMFLLRGQPRHEGLGVEQALYLKGSDDEINAVLHERDQDLPLGAALDQLRNTHLELSDLLESLTESELHRPYRDYLPDEPAAGEGPPVIDLIYGNTAHHFAEHLTWIEQLIRGEA